MVLDLKPILIEQFTKLFENFIWLIPVAFAIAIYLFFLRHEIAEEFMLTHRKKNKLFKKSLMAIILITGVTIAYLYIKEYYFLLVLVIIIVVTYFLYLIGIIDMIVDKMEGRYGR